VIQKSTRSGSLFLSDGQYGGSPEDRLFKFFFFNCFEYFVSSGSDNSGSLVSVFSIAVFYDILMLKRVVGFF
jgi:hypothetical protein